jgi:nucleotide-binding universal stress UspA family protein
MACRSGEESGMAIKDLLVACNDTAASQAALGIALLMAAKYDAHLTGLLVRDPDLFSRRVRGLVPQDVLDNVRELEAAQVARIRAEFEARTAPSGRAGKVHWLEAEGPVDATVIEHTRYFDILLMGRPEGPGGRDSMMLHPDLIALQSGRPVLIVPEGYSTAALVEHAVLAWDGRRAAARALAEAMLILETKSRVDVVTVGDVPGAVDRPGLDVAEHLRRHGITTERVRLEAKGGPVSRAILEHCRAVGAGLVVMGAYEHSKFREDFLGGVTHDLLRGLEVPALMAH